jgi:hypothetical protein
MESYVYGSSTPTEVVVPTSGSIYKKYKTSAVVEEYDAKINELLFAFSTDPGSLNTFKGYAVKPIPEGTDPEEYVQEFADGARELLEMGGTSYIIVATDNGYHIMFFSEVFNADYNFASLEACFTILQLLQNLSLQRLVLLKSLIFCSR